ncbi:hypothetical protein WIS52_11375 [Pseudonocardia nematodicida]|uniref:ASCH domain-containing protein n=1 Tax=Pseudonocardia nematodicida TaxID=1206997 RepID=A0ABV1K9B8_9PSEU
MILPVAVARGVAAGTVDRAYRRWSRPRIRAGSTLRTAAGVVEIVAVDEVAADSIADEDARAAGLASADAVRSAFRGRDGGPVFRIRLRAVGPDPREALRADDRLEPDEIVEIGRRLDRLDRASRRGPWTREVLRLVAEHPGERAADLAARRRRPGRRYLSRPRAGVIIVRVPMGAVDGIDRDRARDHRGSSAARRGHGAG